MIEVKKAKASLTQCTLRGGDLSSSSSTRSTKIDIAISVDVDDRAKKFADFFFPGWYELCDAVARDIDEHPGVTIHSKRSSGGLLTVKMFALADDEAPVLCLLVDGVSGQVKLRVNSLGEPMAEIKFSARMTRREWSSLKDYIDADMFLELHETQVAMFPSTPGSDGGNDSEDSEAEELESDDDTSEGGRSLSGLELRQMRESLGLSRGDLARMLSLTPKTVARYERGERMMTADTQRVALDVLAAAEERAAQA